jgi:hypothetical protein
MNKTILGGKTLWKCPNCRKEVIAVEKAPVPGRENSCRFHQCAALKGILAPMYRAGIKCKVYTVERDDYVSGEKVMYDGAGRPIMSVITVRDDGQDCIAFAPTATAGVVG